MKVLLTMANNPQTPYFTRFANLEKEVQTIDLQFLSLVPSMPDMIAEMEEKGLKCYWIKYDRHYRKSQLLFAFFKCFVLLRRVRPDVVHTHLFEDSLPVLLSAWVLGIRKRVISKLDAGFHFQYSPQWVPFDRLNNRLATDIIAVSEENKRFIIGKEGAKAEKVHLIHQGLPEAELAGGDVNLKKKLVARYGLESKRVILTVARYIHWKGHHRIIEAAKSIISEFPDVVFVFFGAGEEKANIVKNIDQLNLSDSFVVGDWISRKELNHWYEIADIYCNASVNEPFGFVVAEALFKKVPLVTTNTGAATGVLEHLKEAFLFDGSPIDLAQGIKYVLLHDCSEMVSNGYDVATEMFSVELMWTRHKRLYQKL